MPYSSRSFLHEWAGLRRRVPLGVYGNMEDLDIPREQKFIEEL
jgi:hypothetical protein